MEVKKAFMLNDLKKFCCHDCPAMSPHARLGRGSIAKRRQQV
jgi:hypothetical protein